MVAITGWESRTTSSCIGRRMKEVILKIVQSMVLTSGKTMSTTFTGSLKHLFKIWRMIKSGQMLVS